MNFQWHTRMQWLALQAFLISALSKHKLKVMSLSRSVFLFVFMTVCCTALAYTVILKNGKQVQGTFVEDKGSTIEIKDRDGVLLTFRKSTLNLDKMLEVNGGESSAPAPGPTPTQTAPQDTEKPRKATKVYTNEDLKDLPELAVAGSDEPVTYPEETVAEDQPTQDKPAASFDAEAYWKSQTREIGTRLRQVEGDYEYLKQQCDNAREALKYYVLNGYMGVNLAVAQDATYFCDQANQAKAELERQQKDLEDFQDHARKEGALPGWIDPDRIDQ